MLTGCLVVLIGACLAVAITTATTDAQNPKYRVTGPSAYCDAEVVYGPNRLGASAIVPNGRSVILYDEKIMAQLPFLKEFVFAHECGHHALKHATPEGSLREDLPFKTKELNADCWGTKALVKADRVDIVQKQIKIFRDHKTPPAAQRYPTYPERADMLESCSAKQK